MKYLSLLVALSLFSCTRQNVPVPSGTTAAITIDSITGKWALKKDTTQWCIIHANSSVYFPKTIPPVLQGSEYSITVEYYPDLSSHDSIILRTYTQYPEFIFKTSNHAFRQNPSNLTLYETLIRL